MKLNLLVSTSQINSKEGKLLGTGTVNGLGHLAEIMVANGIHGDIYDLPNGSRNPTIASPFSLNNGFALTTDELNLFEIPELEFDPGFRRHLEDLHNTNQQLYRDNRTVSYTLKRTIIPWVLQHCYELFKENLSEDRQTDYQNFCETAAYWLDHYALYEVLKGENNQLQKQDYRDLSAYEALQFKIHHEDLIGYYRYEQFLCYLQRTAIHKKLRDLSIGLIVNLPFGVEFDSADVYFHPEVFEPGIQVGCSPEPEHGYPEQAWGVAVYKERSTGLQEYLSEKMRWLARFGDGVFLDHMVGWCGQYVVPLEIPMDSVYPHGRFLTEDHEKRVENLIWFLEIIDRAGLEIRGEVAGDAPRVRATREAIDYFKHINGTVRAMAIPRWEAENDRLIPLSSYSQSTLMMVETHDTSTLLQYLLNKKGYFDDFEAPQRILEFCRRVLGLPFVQKDIPLQLENCPEDFWIEVFSRLCRGSKSDDVVFTLPGIISLLSPQYRSSTIENNINVKPGTSGKIGNGWRNWSYFSPPIETINEDLLIKQALAIAGRRTYQKFDYFHNLDVNSLQKPGLTILRSIPLGRQIIYLDNHSKWQILPLKESIAGLINAELIVGNEGDREIWHHINLESIIDLEIDCDYRFQDLNGGRECYTYSSAQIKRDGLFVKLQPGQVHHFLVYEDSSIEPLVLSEEESL